MANVNGIYFAKRICKKFLPLKISGKNGISRNEKSHFYQRSQKWSENVKYYNAYFWQSRGVVSEKLGEGIHNS